MFCIHKVNRGMLPACVSTCLGRSLHFGDFNDPGSLVSELKKDGSARRLKEELGNEPNVYYLS